MKRKELIIFSVIVTLVIGFMIYCHFENSIIEVNKLEIKDNNLPQSFDNYKIVQVSDLHNTEFGKGNEKLIKKIKDNNPDVIFITGDLVDSSRTNIDIAINFAEEVNKIAPIYYVTGNHEASINEYELLQSKLEDIGVIILDNKCTEIKKDNDVINIVGFDDPNFVNDYIIDSDSIFSNYLNEINIENDNYTILLSHRPEIFDYYVKQKFNLVFSGHAHGGQFRIPFIGGVIAPNQGMFPRYTSGVYEKENTKMVVSRGLGNSIIPFRINNNPELVVITLKK